MDMLLYGRALLTTRASSSSLVLGAVKLHDALRRRCRFTSHTRLRTAELILGVRAVAFEHRREQNMLRREGVEPELLLPRPPWILERTPTVSRGARGTYLS